MNPKNHAAIPVASINIASSVVAAGTNLNANKAPQHLQSTNEPSGVLIIGTIFLTEVITPLSISFPMRKGIM